jgi:hypothetical protein
MKHENKHTTRESENGDDGLDSDSDDHDDDDNDEGGVEVEGDVDDEAMEEGGVAEIIYDDDVAEASDSLPPQPPPKRPRHA